MLTAMPTWSMYRSDAAPGWAWYDLYNLFHDVCEFGFLKIQDFCRLFGYWADGVGWVHHGEPALRNCRNSGWAHTDDVPSCTTILQRIQPFIKLHMAFWLLQFSFVACGWWRCNYGQPYRPRAPRRHNTCSKPCGHWLQQVSWTSFSVSKLTGLTKGWLVIRSRCLSCGLCHLESWQYILLPSPWVAPSNWLAVGCSSRRARLVALDDGLRYAIQFSDVWFYVLSRKSILTYLG